MAKTDFKSKIKINTYDDLFGGPVSLNEVKYLSLNDLHDFKDHPFQVKDDEDMNKLVESIKEQGVLDPAIVRHRKEGGFEIISGHRRHHAAMLAGLKDMPVIIRDISDDEATLAMVDANLHREKLLPSEKAKAYKMKMAALSSQGKRNDLTLCQVGTRSRSDEKIAEGSDDSARTVQRYIRLTELVPELMSMVDNKDIKFNAGVEISYLSEEEQRSLLSVMEQEGIRPSLTQAKDLHRMSKDGECTEAAIFKLLAVGSVKERRIVLGEDILMRYFHADMTDDEMKRIIIRLLDDWAEGRR
jgi:ParB family chromosome partitioning protein